MERKRQRDRLSKKRCKKAYARNRPPGRPEKYARHKCLRLDFFGRWINWWKMMWICASERDCQYHWRPSLLLLHSFFYGISNLQCVSSRTIICNYDTGVATVDNEQQTRYKNYVRQIVPCRQWKRIFFLLWIDFSSISQMEWSSMRMQFQSKKKKNRAQRHFRTIMWMTLINATKLFGIDMRICSKRF